MTIVVDEIVPASGRTLLQIVQAACSRIGIASPNAVMGNTDPQIMQLREIANEEGEELATGSSIGMAIDWQALQAEATFVSLATEIQGSINTIAPGFRYVINDTLWNRTSRMPAPGSLTPQEWQAYKAWGVANPYASFRIRDDMLLLTPVPAAGQSFYFEFQSENWCLSVDASTHDMWTADTDTCRLDSKLVIAGLIWRWKQIKGLDYAEDFRKYVTRVTGAVARDGGKQTLDMGVQEDFRPGILVPIGSWNH